MAECEGTNQATYVSWQSTCCDPKDKASLCVAAQKLFAVFVAAEKDGLFNRIVDKKNTEPEIAKFLSDIGTAVRATPLSKAKLTKIDLKQDHTPPGEPTQLPSRDNVVISAYDRSSQLILTGIVKRLDGNGVKRLDTPDVTITFPSYLDKSLSSRD